MNTIYRLKLFNGTSHVDAVQPMMQGVFFVGLDDDGLLLFVEAQHFHHHPFTFCDLLQLLAGGVKEVEVVVAIFLTLEDELGVIPRQELDGMQGLDVFVAGFTIELSDTLTCRSIITHQATVILLAVQLKHVDGLAVGTPCDVGEIAVGGIACLQVDGLVGL